MSCLSASEADPPRAPLGSAPGVPAAVAPLPWSPLQARPLLPISQAAWDQQGYSTPPTPQPCQGISLA